MISLWIALLLSEYDLAMPFFIALKFGKKLRDICTMRNRQEVRELVVGPFIPCFSGRFRSGYFSCFLPSIGASAPFFEDVFGAVNPKQLIRCAVAGLLTWLQFRPATVYCFVSHCLIGGRLFGFLLGELKYNHRPPSLFYRTEPAYRPGKGVQNMITGILIAVAYVWLICLTARVYYIGKQSDFQRKH